MRVWSVALVACLISMAGCADSASPEPDDGDDFDGEVEVDDETGGIRGVVVDQTINPLAGATISFLVNGAPMETLSNEEGEFTFSKIPPGSYFLQVSKLLYNSVQVPVDVVAGEKQPEIVKAQLERLVEADPFVSQQQFKGSIVCSYFVSAGASVRAPCITDYTSILVSGGAANFLREVQGDVRGFDYGIGANWQTHVVEATWEQSAQGTSEGLSVSVSFKNRTASHWFANENMEDPLLLRINVGETHANQQDEPRQIDPAGRDDIYTYVNVGGNDNLELAFQQDFELFMHTAYHAPLPDGWSFIAGDEKPF